MYGLISSIVRQKLQMHIRVALCPSTHTNDLPFQLVLGKMLHNIDVAEIPWREEAEIGESSHTSQV